MTSDWCEKLAEATRGLLGRDAVVYSNADPAREWKGTPTIEYSLREVKQRTFLSGEYQRELEMSVVARGNDERESERIVGWVMRRALAPILRDFQRRGEIADWSIQECATSPDLRGMTSGESFFGYVDFKIVETTVGIF